MKIILDLTEKETEKLVNALDEHWDEGPPGEGWSSDELNSLCKKVLNAISENKSEIKA